MKKTAIAIALMLMAAASANAQFGKFTAPEKKTVKDPATGVALTVLTKTDGNDKFIYQTDPMWTPDGKYLLFRSSDRVAGPAQTRTNPDGTTVQYKPSQFFFVEVATGRIVQATDGNTGSVFLGNKSNKMFVNLREGQDWNMYEMNLNTFFADANKGKAGEFKSYLKKIGTFPNADIDDMGNPGGWCVSSDDAYAYITVTRKGTEAEREALAKKNYNPRDDQPKKVNPNSLCGIRMMDLKTGVVTKVIDCDFRVGHIQASRFRSNEILFCCETGGDAEQRMWYCDAAAKTFKPLYNETPLDWVTHETFSSENYAYFNVLGWQDRLRKQASGIFRINLRTDDIDCLGNVEMDKDRSSQLTGRGFWHCNATRDDQWACGDTFAGSVWIINVANGIKIQIASDLKMDPDHAQPFFSPDGKKLCFQSGHYSDGTRLNLVMVDLTKIPLFKQFNK